MFKRFKHYEMLLIKSGKLSFLLIRASKVNGKKQKKTKITKLKIIMMI